MNHEERLYFGLGIIAYAVAKADGKINHEEKEKLHEVVKKETPCYHFELDLTEITFLVLEKYDGYTQEDLFNLGIKEMELGKDFLTDDMRTDFPALLEKVARAFHPITAEENKLIRDFHAYLNS
tara:strand:- start:311 stop:682 length:372 start_codon:yes stop_codon:yes gene_type:complete